MANEGSTKPRYSELEREVGKLNERVSALLDPNNPFYALNHSKCYEKLRLERRIDLDRLEAKEEELADERLAFNHANEVVGKLEAELLRVRGLLQRHGAHTVNCECEYFETGCTCGWEKVSAEYFGTTATIEMSGSGAESADIGKLDRVDKKAG